MPHLMWQVFYDSVFRVLGPRCIPCSELFLDVVSDDLLWCLQAAIASSKETWWNPFSKPQSMSEIHIERRFGQLRSSYASGELTARSYWQAVASLERKHMSGMKKSKDHMDREEAALTPAEFLGVCREDQKRKMCVWGGVALCSYFVV